MSKVFPVHVWVPEFGTIAHTQKPNRVGYVNNLSAQGKRWGVRGDRMILGAYCPASLEDRVSSRLNEKPCLRKSSGETIEEDT